jgi:hypothetical protein
MAAVIGSNTAARIAGFANGRVLEKMAVKSARYPRPLRKLMEDRKQKTQFAGGELLVTVKEPAINVGAQKWSGTPTMQNPVNVQPGMLASFTPSNMFSAFQLGLDDLRKSTGITVIPNDNSHNGDIDVRAIRRDPSAERVLYQKIAEDLESFVDRCDELIELEGMRQGATVDDLAGLNAILPIQNTGNFGGISRASVPAVQHVIFAGNDAGATVPQWMGQRGVSGANMLLQLEKFFRQLRAAAATCGLPKGRWRVGAGTAWLDLFKTSMRAQNMQFQIDGTMPSSGGKVNLLLTDERLGLGSADVQLEWWPVLDTMDLLYSAEVGVGLSQLTVTFAGGGATQQARGIAYVTAAGVISNVIVTDPGVGYTSFPTVTIGNAGGGTGATFQANVYVTGTGTGLITVPADDARIGRLGTVTVTAGGTGYAATNVASPFSNRMYAIYEPALDYWVQDGLDNRLTIPADNPRARIIEQQWDHTHCLTIKAPRTCGVFVASAT